MQRRIVRAVRNVWVAAMLTAIGGQAGTAQGGGCAEDAIIVFDGSGSMAETALTALGEPRIFDARRAMHQAIPEVAPVRRLGLMIYGPGSNDVCSNVDLRFGPIRDAAARILAEIDALRPSGQTPLTLAVSRAVRALGAPDRPGIVVLVTDGRENCGGSPCRLAATLAAEAPSLTVHVIGFRPRSGFFDWPGDGSRMPGGRVAVRCLSDRTGGLFVVTETVDELTDALTQTLGCMVIGRPDRALLPPPA